MIRIISFYIINFYFIPLFGFIISQKKLSFPIAIAENRLICLHCLSSIITGYSNANAKIMTSDRTENKTQLVFTRNFCAVCPCSWYVCNRLSRSRLVTNLLHIDMKTRLQQSSVLNFIQKCLHYSRKKNRKRVMVLSKQT